MGVVIVVAGSNLVPFSTCMIDALFRSSCLAVVTAVWVGIGVPAYGVTSLGIGDVSLRLRYFGIAGSVLSALLVIAAAVFSLVSIPSAALGLVCCGLFGFSFFLMFQKSSQSLRRFIIGWVLFAFVVGIALNAQVFLVGFAGEK